MGLRVDDAEVQKWVDRGLVAPAAVELADRAAHRHVPAIDEKDFQADVEREAKRNGWKVYHTRDSRKSAAGFPDLVMIRGARLIVAELKVGDNRPTAAQLDWLEAFRVAGVPTFVWRPEDWPAIVETLAANDAS